MSVPAWFENSGGLPSDTLDARIFQKVLRALHEVVEKRLTVDMFAHRSVRASVSNIFIPGKTQPGAEPELHHTGAHITHSPLLANPTKGFEDFRCMFRRVFPDARVSCVLVDPPYTPMEQRKLYATFTPKEASALMLEGHAGIERLYREALTWACQTAKDLILAFGYKCPDLPGWTMAAVVAAGAGSGHPTIFCCCYTRDDARRKWVVGCLTHELGHPESLHVQHGAKGFSPTEKTREMTCEDLDAGVLPEGAGEPIVCTVLGSQTLLKQYRDAHPGTSLPANHPSYLSRTNERLFDLSWASPLIVRTRIWHLYEWVRRKGPNPRRLFARDTHEVERIMCEHAPFADCELVLKVKLRKT